MSSSQALIGQVSWVTRMDSCLEMCRWDVKKMVSEQFQYKRIVLTWHFDELESAPLKMRWKLLIEEKKFSRAVNLSSKVSVKEFQPVHTGTLWVVAPLQRRHETSRKWTNLLRETHREAACEQPLLVVVRCLWTDRCPPRTLLLSHFLHTFRHDHHNPLLTEPHVANKVFSLICGERT